MLYFIDSKEELYVRWVVKSCLALDIIKFDQWLATKVGIIISWLVQLVV